MRKLAFGRAVLHCLAAALFAVVTFVELPTGFSPLGGALAQPADAERQAFEAAKELGTVEAWDAFLSNYPKGFHADLARAYVKKLAEQPAAASPQASPAPAAAAPASYPMSAGSWGGIVRNGPGQSYAKVGSLQEGDPVTLVEKTEVFENGFPWFKITYSGGGSGYQWGGNCAPSARHGRSCSRRARPKRSATGRGRRHRSCAARTAANGVRGSAGPRGTTAARPRRTGQGCPAKS